jgi:putative membrane protein insertion efficiency factor
MAMIVLRALIAVYRYGISPFTPLSCRYLPTCSEYAEEAVALHGPWRGGWLALRRVSRCHPLGGHGYDPVPGPHEEAADGVLRSQS